jgi:hypothetical protein
MSAASDWTRARVKSEASRPMLVVQNYADPLAMVTDGGMLSLPHATEFDVPTALALARWIHDTFS